MFGTEVKVIYSAREVNARKEAARLSSYLREGWSIATELPEHGGQFTILTRKRTLLSLIFRRKTTPPAVQGEAVYLSAGKQPKPFETT